MFTPEKIASDVPLRPDIRIQAGPDPRASPPCRARVALMSGIAPAPAAAGLFMSEDLGPTGADAPSGYDYGVDDDYYYHHGRAHDYTDGAHVAASTAVTHRVLRSPAESARHLSNADFACALQIGLRTSACESDSWAGGDSTPCNAASHAA